MKKKILDVSGEKFQNVDFNEGTLIYAFPREMPELLTLEVWGLSISASGFMEELHDVPIIKSPLDYIYISGFSKVTFEGVESAFLDIALFNPEKEIEFIKMTNGEPIGWQRKWGKVADFESCIYLLGGNIDWPPGGFNLGINSVGNIRIEFHIEDCILVTDYSKNPWKFGYKFKHL